MFSVQFDESFDDVVKLLDSDVRLGYELDFYVRSVGLLAGVPYGVEELIGAPIGFNDLARCHDLVRCHIQDNSGSFLRDGPFSNPILRGPCVVHSPSGHFRSRARSSGHLINSASTPAGPGGDAIDVIVPRTLQRRASPSALNERSISDRRLSWGLSLSWGRVTLPTEALVVLSRDIKVTGDLTIVTERLEAARKRLVARCRVRCRVFA